MAEEVAEAAAEVTATASAGSSHLLSLLNPLSWASLGSTGGQAAEVRADANNRNRSISGVNKNSPNTNTQETAGADWDAEADAQQEGIDVFPMVCKTEI